MDAIARSDHEVGPRLWEVPNVITDGDSRQIDDGLATVAGWIRSKAGIDIDNFFGELVRKALDEVVDGPRTGRWSLDQLESTEKTYVGTKIEIIVRSALDLVRGEVMDLEIEGQPVDVKWSKHSQWQIPEEAVGHICLCIGGLQRLTSFQVGLIRCTPDVLNPGRNKDRKTTITAAQRQRRMTMLVNRARLPPDFVAEIRNDVRDRILDGATIQERVTRLFSAMEGVPIPRRAIQTVARTDGDPMRRSRVDRNAGDSLEGMRILSAQYGNGVALALGYPRLAPDEFMAVRASVLLTIPAHLRDQLTPAARLRYGL